MNRRKNFPFPTAQADHCRPFLQRRRASRGFPAALSLVLTAAIAAPPLLNAEDAAVEWIDSHLDETVKLYEHFHRNPELSFHEKETAARVTEELRQTGCDVVTGVGGHGVVGLLKNGEGPTVMWRCDLDALPVAEATGLEYASTVRTKNDDGADVGVMHACGHDVHMTNLITAAKFFSQHRELWRGTLMFVGQPAEERGAGALQMLEAGLFSKIRRPDFALAAHVDATLPAGFIGYRSGYALANVDSCDITVNGRGGHGSFPQGCIDPIVQAAELVMALQTIVSREVSPLEPAVVTVGFHPRRDEAQHHSRLVPFAVDDPQLLPGSPQAAERGDHPPRRVAR